MTQIIGLTGPAGSGKSVAAEALIAEGFKRVRVSEPLKNMLRAYYASFGLVEEDIERRIEGDLKDLPDDLLFGKTPRHAMQTLGTEWGRVHIDEGIWAKVWKIRAHLITQMGHSIVAEDIRFDDEEEALRQLGGALVALSGRSKEKVATGGHASEQMETLTPDVTIVNDSTKEELGSKVKLAAQFFAMQKAAA